MKKTHTQIDREYAAELLKERIYATLALIAVLISIDTGHYSPLHAGFLVIGTIVSLWAASMVSTVMARRVVYQGSLDSETERTHLLRKHAPMLAALVFPVFMIFLSFVKLIPLSTAITISIMSAVLLLVAWSVLSARSMKASRVPTIILVAAEVAIGMAVVGLKLLISH